MLLEHKWSKNNNVSKKQKQILLEGLIYQSNRKKDVVIILWPLIVANIPDSETNSIVLCVRFSLGYTGLVSDSVQQALSDDW